MSRNVTARQLALIAPAIFLLHVSEEAPGFVAWFNSHVPRGITRSDFLTVNAGAFVVTVLTVLFVVVSPGRASGLVVSSWISFVMLANGIFHLVATVVYARYCPGVVTGTLLYFPYSILLLRWIVRDLRIRPMLALSVAFAGAVPMLLHGYLIVFRSSRLF